MLPGRKEKDMGRNRCTIVPTIWTLKSDFNLTLAAVIDILLPKSKRISSYEMP